MDKGSHSPLIHVVRISIYARLTYSFTRTGVYFAVVETWGETGDYELNLFPP